MHNKCSALESFQNHSRPPPRRTPIREKIVFHKTGVKEVGDLCLTQHIADSPEY